MNDTWYTSPISGIIENGVAFDRMLSTFLLVIFILLQLSFPFYVYVIRVNRERDKNTLVFPLIDHFYEMMKKTQAMFVFLYVTGFFLVVKAELKIFVGMIIAWMLCFYALTIFTQVFQFFLTIMAVQKFLLYFFPSSQKYIILSGKICDTLFVFPTIYSLIYFFSMNITFFASALLYIPIMISVQKMSHLRSVQESKPHIYIFWQTMTALVVKMIHTFLFSFTFYDNLEEMVVFTRMLDVFSVPVIIQISYLTCNRQNVITLFASFRGMKLIRELISPEITTVVSPDPRRHLISSPRNN